uniref:histidine kinase n=2 Tax=Pseudonocardiaceae TaxID=2070 RepID=A0A2W4L621_9PSEU|nr:MAG: ATP-binding protein [Thermocrispum agreste]
MAVLATVVVEAVAAVAHPASTMAGAEAITVLVQLPAAVLVGLRKRRPLWLVAATFLGTVALLVLTLAGVAADRFPGDAVTVFVPVITPVAVYAAAAYPASPRRAVPMLAALFLVASRPWDPHPAVVTVAAVVVGLPAVLGLYVAARRRLIAELIERAEHAEREQAMLAERARADERARLAEEMHEVVTERVRQMLAGAERLPGEPARHMIDAGRQVLAELADLVAALRADLPGEQAAATVSSLEQLAEESAAVGLPVELVHDGDIGDLSPAVHRTVHRVVQESLTNVRKHAPGARTQVRVSRHGGRVRVVVRNSPPASRGGDAELAATGSGLGLRGLRHRVELVGGTVRAGREPDGGFAVDAVLPDFVPAPTGGGLA